jgi:hypothetical protein
MIKTFICITLLLAVASAHDWAGFLVAASAAQDVRITKAQVSNFDFSPLDYDQLMKAFKYTSLREEYEREDSTPIFHRIASNFRSKNYQKVQGKNEGLNRVLASIDNGFGFERTDFRFMAVKYKSSMQSNVYDDLYNNVGKLLQKGYIYEAGFNFGLISHYLYIAYLQDPKYWPNIKPWLKAGEWPFYASSL